MNRSTRLFLVVSLALLITDVIFVAVNYHSAQRQFDASMREHARQQLNTFQLAMKMEEDNLLKLVRLVAKDPQVVEILARGREAVLREGGGGGGPEAARIRQQLLTRMGPFWDDMQEWFGMRQLHFHLGPGVLSFLRVHEPDKFGDRLDDLRHMVMDTSRDGQPRSGFETGRTYSGIRGVSPIVATDAQGEQVQIGSVELGASFEHLFQVIDEQLQSGAALLLKAAHFREKMRPERIEETFAMVLNDCDCAVDSYSRPQFRALLENHERLPKFQGEPFLITYAQIDGRKFAVTHLPVFDYLSLREGKNQYVGRVLLWQDVQQERELLASSLNTAIVYATLGYLVVELLLLWAVLGVTRRLQGEIDRSTRALRSQKEELLELKERAEAANRAKSAFLANMGHELRTPLNAVLGYTQILQGDQRLHPQLQPPLSAIRRAGRALLTLLNDILDLATMRSGELQLNIAPCDPRRLIDELAQLFQLPIQEKGLDLRIEGTPELPATLLLDEQRLRHVCMNLLGNAVKFTDTGEVGILVAYREEQLCITITDEGPGIPKERMGNLFTPFQQLDDDPYKQHGSGLGLAICQSLTEQMGGVLTVESELGAGSRFEVSVPAPHSQETLTVSPESRPGEAEAVPQADNETVTQALCQLSPQQREQLREALEDGNRRHIREILVTMQALHPLATATLMRHLENFDYPWIADRLSDCPDDESGV